MYPKNDLIDTDREYFSHCKQGKSSYNSFSLTEQACNQEGIKP
jgi:hypothetical protein